MQQGNAILTKRASHYAEYIAFKTKTPIQQNVG